MKIMQTYDSANNDVFVMKFKRKTLYLIEFEKAYLGKRYDFLNLDKNPKIFQFFYFSQFFFQINYITP